MKTLLQPPVPPGQTGISVCVWTMSVRGNRSENQIVSTPGLISELCTGVSTTGDLRVLIMLSGKIIIISETSEEALKWMFKYNASYCTPFSRSFNEIQLDIHVKTLSLCLFRII